MNISHRASTNCWGVGGTGDGTGHDARAIQDGEGGTGHDTKKIQGREQNERRWILDVGMTAQPVGRTSQ